MSSQGLDPFQDASSQAEWIRRGDVSPRELVEAAIERIEALNPALNAVIHERFGAALEDADRPLVDGPFAGVPYLQKDLDLAMAGEPCHNGTRFLRDHRYVPERDSTLTSHFSRAGLISVGRTNTPELGLLPTTETETTGATANPWAPSRIAGGSSGGAAAAVASGMVPVAHASDGGGSIRIPASACGLVGLKATRGRMSVGPDVGESWAGMGTEGVVTRSVRDTARLLDVMSVPGVGDPYIAPPPPRPFSREPGTDTGLLRIGVRTAAPAGGVTTHPDCVRAVATATALLADLGHIITEDAPGALDDAEMEHRFVECFTVWVARELDRMADMVGAPVTEDGVESSTWLLAEAGRAVSATTYLESLDDIHRYSRRMAQWWSDGFDILVTPTIGEPPPPLGQFAPTEDEPLRSLTRSAELVAFTAPFNSTGQPAISLPLHWNADGLPIGVQFVAAHGREDLLLRLAAQLEVLVPWSERRPPIRAAEVERRGRTGSAVAVPQHHQA